MAGARFGFRTGVRGFEPPIELRFVDLFMILLTGFIFITVVLSLLSALGSHGEEVKPPRITTLSIPEAIAGRPYRVALAAVAGSGGYRWAESGRLPDGLVLSQSGMISGTPRSQETGRVDILVTDKNGRRDSTTLVVTVIPPLRDIQEPKPQIRIVGQTAIPDAVENNDYHFKLNAEGGNAPYTWKASSALPRNLTLLPDGTISGKPNEPEVGRAFTFDVEITDAIGGRMSQQIRLWILAEPAAWWKKILSWGALALWFWFLWRGGYSPGIKNWLQGLSNRARQRSY